MNNPDVIKSPATPNTGSLERVVRRRGRRGRMKRGWRKLGEVSALPTLRVKAEPQSKLTESEFVEWLRELAADPKWKRPTQWDEHTFRVGVQIALKRVSPPNGGANPTGGGE